MQEHSLHHKVILEVAVHLSAIPYIICAKNKNFEKIIHMLLYRNDQKKNNRKIKTENKREKNYKHLITLIDSSELIFTRSSPCSVSVTLSSFLSSVIRPSLP